VFYEEFQTKKIQLRDNRKEGFGLVYEGKKLKKAEKYMNDKKTREWTSVFSFRKDNPDVRF